MCKMFFGTIACPCPNVYMILSKHAIYSHFIFLSMSLLLHNQRIRSKFFMSVHKLPRFQLDTPIVRSRFMQNLSFSSPAKFCQTGPQSICGNWLSLSPSDFSSHLQSFWFHVNVVAGVPLVLTQSAQCQGKCALNVSSSWLYPASLQPHQRLTECLFAVSGKQMAPWSLLGLGKLTSGSKLRALSAPRWRPSWTSARLSLRCKPTLAFESSSWRRSWHLQNK